MPRIAGRKPGRPAGESTEQREALLDAAAELFAENGSEGASLKQIADRARVSAPLAAYYFGGKDGLFEAVLAERLEPRLGVLVDAIRARTGPAGPTLAVFIQQFGALAARNPWLPALAQREPDAMAQLTDLLRTLIERGQEEGEIRRDLESSSIVLSLLSLCCYAWTARATLAPSLGLELDVAGASRLTLHHLALLRYGLHKPRQESSA